MPRGAKPKPEGEKINRNAVVHPFDHAASSGWQHGRRPAPPRGLTDAGRKAWQTWLSGWWAAFYKPEDLPGLELTVLTFDRVQRGELDVAKVIPLLDRYGITPKGRQDLRWLPPKDEKPAVPAVSSSPRLRVVDTA